MAGSGEDFLIYPSDLGGQHFGYDPELGDNIYQRADPAFQGKEFVQDHYLSLFQDTIAALEIAPFIANDVLRIIQDALKLV
jgi:hypothetical protein